jgi:hypothetical protein
MPRFQGFHLPASPDTNVYLVALLLAIVSGFLFGAVPVRQVLHTDPYQIVKSGSLTRVGRRLNVRDVLLVAAEGRGRITIDGRSHMFAAGQVVVVPKGSRREIEAIGGRFAYLTCHLHRPPLMPVVGIRARE